MLEIIVYIIVWGVVVKLILITEPKQSASTFKKIVWILLWLFTLSFFFGNSSSSSYSAPTGGGDYGGGYDCDDDFGEDDTSFDAWESPDLDDSFESSWDDDD